MGINQCNICFSAENALSNVFDWVVWYFRDKVLEKVNNRKNNDSCTWFSVVDKFINFINISCDNILNKLWISKERWIERFWYSFRDLIIQLSWKESLSKEDNLELKNEMQKITTLYTLMKSIFCPWYDIPDWYISKKMSFIEFSWKLHAYLLDNTQDFNWKNFWEIVDKILKYMLIFIKKRSNLSKRAIKEIFWFSSLNFNIDIVDSYEENNPSTDESAVFLSKERKVEELRNLVYDKIFREKVDSWEISKKDVVGQMRKLNLAYALVKLKFQWSKRKSWERYFEHLKEVTLIWLKEWLTKDFNEVLISMLHDIIEDTDISFQTLRELFWERIAIWVELISKNNLTNYISDGWDLQELREIRRFWILNDKWWIKDSFKKKIRKLKELISPLQYEYLIHYWNITKDIKETLKLLWISENKIFAFIKYKELEEKYKKSKNDAYWYHMDSLEDFYSKAHRIRREHIIRLSDKALKWVAQKSLTVKLSDRIHNLRTMRELWTKHIARNLIDTKKLLKLAKELFLKDCHGNWNKWVLLRKIRILCKEALDLSYILQDSSLISYFSTQKDLLDSSSFC